MPKLRQTTEQTRKMQGVIAKCLKETGIEKRHLATKLHLSLTSLYARLNEPERFTVGELKKMAAILKFSDTDKQAFI